MLVPEQLPPLKAVPGPLPMGSPISQFVGVGLLGASSWVLHPPQPPSNPSNHATVCGTCVLRKASSKTAGSPWDVAVNIAESRSPGLAPPGMFTLAMKLPLVPEETKMDVMSMVSPISRNTMGHTLPDADRSYVSSEVPVLSIVMI